MDCNRDIIIIVDDDITNLAIARNSLVEEYSVVTVSSGEKLFLLLEKITPSLILLDIEMPGMDGFEVLRRLKASESHAGLPVIFLTAKNDPDIESKGLILGAVDFITKPFSALVLENRIKNHLKIDRLIKDLAESRELYRTIYNNSAMGIYMSTPEGKFLTCNNAFAAILGYDSPDELLTLLRNQDDQFYDQTGRRQELLALLREKREVPFFESEVLGRDGDLLWVSESCTATFDDTSGGELLYYQSIIADVTARKQAENDLLTIHNLIHTTIHSLCDGILVTDLYGHLIMANRAATIMLEQQLEAGATPAFLVDPPDTSPFSRFQERFDSQTGVVSITPSDHNKQINCTILPYKNAMDAVIGAVHVLRHSA